MAKKKPKSKVSKASKQTPSSVNESVDENVLSSALISPHQPVLMKVCRLCETRDGPFLNIFDTEKNTARQIDELMPFRVAENDDLPHKICFRCSAKVEELHEFIQKCTKTQENLRSVLGKKGPLETKPKTRALWEEKLNKTNLTNDDICDALIKKAMEGIKDITYVSSDDETEKPSKKSKAETAVAKKVVNDSDDDDCDKISLKQVKLNISKCDENVRVTRAKKNEPTSPVSEPPAKKFKVYSSKKPQNKTESIQSVEDITEQPNAGTSSDKPVEDTKKSKELADKEKEPKKPFNIMDHVSTIKVFGVGILFQCKLCNRNFLKKEVVESHGCAKNNIPKDTTPNVPAVTPEAPKPSTVKYITMGKGFKKPEPNKKVESKVVESKEITVKPVQQLQQVQPEVIKPKPKIGPASKVRREKETPPPPVPTPPPEITMKEVKTNPVVPSVSFPTMPNLNTRYKLVPGPNNTFTLVEDASQSGMTIPSLTPLIPSTPVMPDVLRQRKTLLEGIPSKCSAQIIDIDDSMPIHPPAPLQKEQPYPVGLFQTVPHHSSVYPPPIAQQPAFTQPPAFTTPAMKKQSYTIVQTGNPSKLLISTKPQPVQEEPVKKKSKKHKMDTAETKEPYKVTLEENPASKPSSFFTFVNVDPLLQPSYVLPTNNIIQESQISTSTPGSKAAEAEQKYQCNMCNEEFSREKKLLAHIQSHYNQMDAEDEKRAGKAPKKKSKKS